MERALTRRPSLAQRLFTEEERRFCEAMAWPAEHYAAHYAARRAVLKALGCPCASRGDLRKVAVRQADGARPTAVLAPDVQAVAEAQGVSEVALSLSFTHEVATAMALLVTDEVRPQPKEERDPERELRTSFKEARSVIDELERLQGDVAATLE